MLAKLKQFFEENIMSEGVQTQGEHALHLAAAALLVEIMQSDDESDDREMAAVISGLGQRFELTEQEAANVVELAHQELEDAIDYHQFTSLINNHFEYDQKVRLLEVLWQVAFADGVLDRYEEHAIRKISDLLYLRHSDFVAAKHRVSPH